MFSVAKKPEPKLHKYSTGLHFYQKADVKRICCDQLVSLELHKERGVGNKERKHMVVRKLHQLGGWIRVGRNKDRTYVAAGTELPDYLQPKQMQSSVGNPLDLGFQ